MDALGLEEVLHSVADAITAHDPAGRLVYVFGERQPTWLSQRWELRDSHGRLLLPHEWPFVRVFSRTQALQTRLQLRSPATQRSRWMDVRACVVLRRLGGPLSVAVWRDVSAQRRLEQQLVIERRARRASQEALARTELEATLSELLRERLERASLSELATRIAAAFADVCIIDLLRRGSPPLRLVRAREGSLVQACLQLERTFGDPRALREWLGEGPAVELQRLTQPGADPGHFTPLEQRLIAELGVRARLRVRIACGGEGFGALTLLTRRPVERIHPEDVRVISGAASQLGAALFRGVSPRTKPTPGIQ